MRINIYIGNHSEKFLIDDVVYLNYIFSKRNIDVITSIELEPDSINIIFDDFCDYERSKKIIDFKRNNPKTVIIIVSTEHIVEKYFARTFNFFSGGIRDAAVISLLNVFYRISIKHFSYPTLRDLAVAIVYSPILMIDYMMNIIKFTTLKKIGFYYKRPRSFGYNLKRYIGFEKMANYADSIFMMGVTDPNYIAEYSKNYKRLNLPKGTTVIGTFFPEIDVDDIKKNIFINKKLFIEVTGTVTPYRFNKMQEINDDISNLNLQNSFSNCKDFPKGGEHEISAVVSKEGIIRGAYSLHPPQSETWRYASSTRIYRALCIDYNMPILTKNFNQHPIEDVCFIYDDKEQLFQFRDYYFNIEKFLPILESRIDKYMVIAEEHNDKFIENLSALLLLKN